MTASAGRRAATDRFACARRAGAAAWQAGADRASNPYPDTRTARGCVTFSRAWVRAWFQGYDDAAAADDNSY